MKLRTRVRHPFSYLHIHTSVKVVLISSPVFFVLKNSNIFPYEYEYMMVMKARELLKAPTLSKLTTVSGNLSMALA